MDSVARFYCGDSLLHFRFLHWISRWQLHTRVAHKRLVSSWKHANRWWDLKVDPMAWVTCEGRISREKFLRIRDSFLELRPVFGLADDPYKCQLSVNSDKHFSRTFGDTPRVVLIWHWKNIGIEFLSDIQFWAKHEPQVIHLAFGFAFDAARFRWWNIYNTKRSTK